MPEDEKKLQTFDDDAAFISHIISRQLPEELVVVPEWGVEVLCRPLDAPTLMDVQIKASDPKTQKTDYRKTLFEIIAGGCYNPATGKRAFTESHRAEIMRDGSVILPLALAVMRLSKMVNTQDTKKN